MSNSNINREPPKTFNHFFKIVLCYGSLMIAITSLSYILEQNHLHHHQICTTSEYDHCDQKDPCHLKIEHGNLVDGCQHNTHLSIPHEPCSKCDAVSHYKNFYCFNPFKKDILRSEYLSIFTYNGLSILQLDSQQYSRGPPLFLV